MAYLILLENEGGELDRVKVKDERDLKSKLLDLVDGLGSINPGDTFRIVEDGGTSRQQSFR